MSFIDVKFRAYCRDGSVKCNNLNDEIIKLEIESERGSKITLEIEGKVHYYRTIIKRFPDILENIIHNFSFDSFLLSIDSLSGEITVRRENGNSNS